MLLELLFLEELVLFVIWLMELVLHHIMIQIFAISVVLYLTDIGKHIINTLLVEEMFHGQIIVKKK